MTDNNHESPPPKGEVNLAVIILILGTILTIISKNTSIILLKDYGVEFGFTLIAFSTSIIIWKLYASISSSGVIRFVSFIKKENLIDIFKGKEQEKYFITKSVLEWAQDSEKNTLKIKGVNLNLILGNNGILNEFLEEKKIINRDLKKIKILLLNPYSTNAITRSIQESRPFEFNINPAISICEHTLEQHKKGMLYTDFECVIENVKDLIRNVEKHKIEVECRIYNTLPPNFLLINTKRAICHYLIMGKRKDTLDGKLYTILPYLIYRNGEIKDSLESHFDYTWEYDAMPLNDFHQSIEEKYFQINRLFILYNLQKAIWERQWDVKTAGRSFGNAYDILYQEFKELYPMFIPKNILDLGCGDGGGGSLTMLKEYPNAKIHFVDISEKAIDLLRSNISNEGLESNNTLLASCDMLTFLNCSDHNQYSLIHANYSIIYMTKIKAIEIYRNIFNVLQNGGIFMLSLWTVDYFKMPLSKHGEGGRPNHIFEMVPMSEQLMILVGGSKNRIGEIRRLYRGIEELLDEFKIADDSNSMDFENMNYRYYENGAILRVWIVKK